MFVVVVGYVMVIMPLPHHIRDIHIHTYLPTSTPVQYRIRLDVQPTFYIHAYTPHLSNLPTYTYVPSYLPTHTYIHIHP